VKKGWWKVCALLVVLLISAAACSGGQQPVDEGKGGSQSKGKLVFGVTPWTSTIPPTYVAKHILEDLGYEVKLQDAEVGVVFAGLAKGDVDIFMDSWLPDMHREFMDQYGEKIDDVAVSYREGVLGWVVPAYSPANSIAELNQYKDRFGGKVYGIDAGAGMMKTSKAIIEAYGLDYELVDGSEQAMLTMLEDAYSNKRDIVILGWRPHWKFAKYDLKFLEDPKGFWKSSEVHVLVHKGLDQKAPEAYAFLKNWRIPIEDVEDMILRLELESADPTQLAADWVENNQEKVEAMLKDVK
jgi:glycine betaine/proline transport system substrate-binding protein